MIVYQIGAERLTVERLAHIVESGCKLALCAEATEAIVNCRKFLDDKLSRTANPIYGINTGFGSLQNVGVAGDKLCKLQHNLILSHACGAGEKVPKDIIKLMLLLKIQSLSYGYSGVCLATVQRLIDFYNEDILPVIYQQGSLGASGDLAPLAHLALPLIGEGSVYYAGETLTTKELYKRLQWNALQLESKEGLALINGTQFMSAYGVWCLLKAQEISKWADIIAASSADAFNCRIEPFLALSHKIRPHKGQMDTAGIVSSLLADSEIVCKLDKQTQDPYSFRCVPQVHGASKDAIDYVLSVFEVEINSVTDNPNIFPDEDLIISAGNFHGQALALGFDFMCIALAELGSIAERRVFQLISGTRGLPPFLTRDAGLNSGMMILQYTAASIVSENKQLCTPAAIDSIVSSNGQEDHVSMGANAATKCWRVVQNLETLLAIELVVAMQALDFRRPLKSSVQIEKLHSAFRQYVSFNDEDRILADDISLSKQFLGNCVFLKSNKKG